MQFLARIRELELANRAAEAKCQELVETVARSAQNAARQVSKVKQQMEDLKQSHQEAVKKVLQVLLEVDCMELGTYTRTETVIIIPNCLSLLKRGKVASEHVVVCGALDPFSYCHLLLLVLSLVSCH